MKKIISLIFVFILTLSCVACNLAILPQVDPTAVEEAPTVIRQEDDPAETEETVSDEPPADFSFSISQCYVDNNFYFDSKTGEFKMEDDCCNEYTAHVKISENELKQVYTALFQNFHMQDYPESSFAPINRNEPGLMNVPPMMSFTIYAMANSETYKASIYCNVPYGERAALWEAYDKAVGLIVSSLEWKTYPVIRHEDDPSEEMDLTELPADFSFSIAWGDNSQNSYDSESGDLVWDKKVDPNFSCTCLANLKMSQSELMQIYSALCLEIHLQDYPNIYNPFDADLDNGEYTKTTIVSVTANGQTYQVSYIDSPDKHTDESDFPCEEARTLWEACKKVRRLICSCIYY